MLVELHPSALHACRGDLGRVGVINSISSLLSKVKHYNRQFCKAPHWAYLDAPPCWSYMRAFSPTHLTNKTLPLKATNTGQGRRRGKKKRNVDSWYVPGAVSGAPQHRRTFSKDVFVRQEAAKSNHCHLDDCKCHSCHHCSARSCYSYWGITSTVWMQLLLLQHVS